MSAPGRLNRGLGWGVSLTFGLALWVVLIGAYLWITR